MWWINLKPKLLMVWSWLVHHWYIPLVIVVAILALISGKRNVVDWRSIIGQINDSHRDEVDAIHAAHDEEITKYNAAVNRMEEARKQVQAEYDRNQRELDSKKQKEIERILKQTKDDPFAMQKALEQSTGFHIVVIN